MSIFDSEATATAEQAIFPPVASVDDAAPTAYDLAPALAPDGGTDFEYEKRDHTPPLASIGGSAADVFMVPPRGVLERLPKWLIVIPLLLQWLYLSLRHRSAMLPSVANPCIVSGGLVGEGKTEYFDSMGPVARGRTARHNVFTVVPATALDDARACLHGAGLAYPIIAKPDIGWCGFGVRLIESDAALADYVSAFPAGERVVLQTYVADEREAGIFYVRRPGAQKGEIVGLALRSFPQVVGDGVKTLAELVSRDPRLRRLQADGLHRVTHDPALIPARGQRLRLATIGSTRVGGLYRDGSGLVTAELARVIDTIARDMREFHFGRFDVRYASEAALGNGEGFTIIEVNGAGSEAIEAWDPALGPWAAFRTIFAKQALLFEIAAANRARGFVPMSLRALARLHLRQQRLIPRYPPSN